MRGLPKPITYNSIQKKIYQAQQKAKREQIYCKIELLFRKHGITGFEREYHFNKPESRHRFDWAFPRFKVAVEYEGGQWSAKARHQTGKGFLGDILKYNRAAELGWVVLRLCRDMLDDDPDAFMIQLKNVLTRKD